MEHWGQDVTHCSGRPGCSAHSVYIVQVETGFVDAEIEIQGYDTTNIVMGNLSRRELFEFLDHRVSRTDQCPTANLSLSEVNP